MLRKILSNHLEITVFTLSLFSYSFLLPLFHEKDLTLLLVAIMASYGTAEFAVNLRAITEDFSIILRIYQMLKNYIIGFTIAFVTLILYSVILYAVISEDSRSAITLEMTQFFSGLFS